VDLSKLKQRPNVGNMLIRLDFETDIREAVFFIKEVGVEESHLGHFIIKNPFILTESMESSVPECIRNTASYDDFLYPESTSRTFAVKMAARAPVSEFGQLSAQAPYCQGWACTLCNVNSMRKSVVRKCFICCNKVLKSQREIVLGLILLNKNTTDDEYRFITHKLRVNLCVLKLLTGTVCVYIIYIYIYNIDTYTYYITLRSILMWTFQAHIGVSVTGRLLSGLRKWYYNAAGFNKLGLMRDDTMHEDDDVKEALKRLPESVYNDRMFRIKRALDLSMKQQVLPKDQWTKYEEVCPFVIPKIVLMKNTECSIK
ncbi:QCR7 protein, partial [Polyodon spathula]|nr:QCR7 protein [Polyodon spathula]